jgi:hypothetical protein
MAIDLDEQLKVGGKARVELLLYSVLSVQLEPLFLCLVQDYQVRPTADRAGVLFDVFLAASAPARVRAEAVLPPRDPRLEAALRPWRDRQAAAPEPTLPGERRLVLLPPRDLFDGISAYLRKQADGPLQQIARTYDPERTPHENLPGGKLSAGGRHFLDNVWKPRVRPMLVAAGFGRVSSLG